MRQTPLKPRVVQAAHRPNPRLRLGPQPLLRLPERQHAPYTGQDTDWVIITTQRREDTAQVVNSSVTATGGKPTEHLALRLRPKFSNPDRATAGIERLIARIDIFRGRDGTLLFKRANQLSQQCPRLVLG
jgi:hypothetical protein